MVVLTDAKAKALAIGGAKLADGLVKGLWLVPAKGKGRGYWTLRYVSPTSGKRRDLGLGTFPDVSIGKARDLGRVAREQIAQGLDPIELRDEARRLAAMPSGSMSFVEAAERFIEQRRAGWRNAKHSDQWTNTLATYAYPAIGNRPVDELVAEDFRKILAPIWLSKAETASRVKQRCHAIMDWCAAHAYVQFNVVGLVSKLLPDQKRGLKVQHFPSLPWKMIPDFVAKILNDSRRGTGTCRELIELLILTATRSGEARNMVWGQIDLDGQVWTIPADSTKMGREHKVPLSGRCMLILDAQQARQRKLTGKPPKATDLVFPSPRGKVFSDMTLSKFLKDHEVASDTTGKWAVPHGFRTSFRGWATVQRIYEPIIELCLAHVEANKVVAAYKREVMLEERREVMDAYAAFVCSALPMDTRKA